MKSGTSLTILLGSLSALFAHGHLGETLAPHEPEEVESVLPYRSVSLNWNVSAISVEDSYAAAAAPLRPAGSGDQCGGVRKVRPGEHGVIKSPGYPRSYPAGVDCEWTLVAPPGSNIQATMFDARTQNNPYSDYSDALLMSLTGKWDDSQRFSGNMNPFNPMAVISEGNRLGLRLRSAKNSRGRNGFRMAYLATERQMTPVAGLGMGPPNGGGMATDVACPTVPININLLPVSLGLLGGSVRDEDSDSYYDDGLNRTNPNPWLVALILDDIQFCAGTLVSERHVVTSAQCTRGVKRFDMIFGTDDLSVSDAGVQKRRATTSDVLVHPDFDELTGANDISVITLKRNVTYTRFVYPATIPSWRSIGMTFNDFRLDMAGWGDTEKGEVYTRSGEIAATVVPNSFCRAAKSSSTSGLTMCSRPTGSRVCRANSGSPAYNAGLNCASTTGSGGANVFGTPKPSRPPKPGKPSKPAGSGRPSKPGRPSRPSKPAQPGGGGTDAASELLTPILLGVVSRGSCDQEFSITRITAYLDFLSTAMAE